MTSHSRFTIRKTTLLFGHGTRIQRRMKHSTAFITTPIYYVNAVPHIGHLYSSVIADTLKRYYALKGADAYLCTGTDEHGLKIQQAAAKNNAPPIEFCNQVSKSFKELSDAADISYTSFIRTTEPRHAKAVAALWTELEKKGYIYKGKHEGWYAVSDEAFYASNQVQEAVDEKTGEKIMIATESGQRVEWTEEENYKFKLSAFEEPLLKWIDDNPTAIVPSNRKNEVTQWIKQGLADLSISRLRSRLDWGIPVPNDPGHTIYVWLDALTNYLTVNGYPWITTENNKGEGTQNSKITNAWPADVHVVGKDIVRFHAIYWPAFLMAAQLPLPKQILAHAHWTMGKQKMSKSRGNVADPFQVMNTYGVDPVRYYLVRDGGFADDGDYSEENIIKRYKDLAGQLGNLLNRCTAPSLNPNATIPATPKNSDARDETLRTKLAELPGIFDESFESREFGKGISAVFDMLAEANKNFQDNKPWDLVKDPSQKERLDQVIYHAIESCRVAGILLQPVLPSKMNTLLTRLGVPSEKRSLLDAYPQQEQSETPLGENREPVLFPRLKK